MGRTYFNSGLDTMMAKRYQEPLNFADIHFSNDEYGEGTLSVVRTTHASNRKFTRDISSEDILRVIVKGLNHILELEVGFLVLEANSFDLENCPECENLRIERFGRKEFERREKKVNKNEAIIVLLKLEYENYEPKATIITTITKPSVGLFKTDDMLVTL